MVFVCHIKLQFIRNTFFFFKIGYKIPKGLAISKDNRPLPPIKNIIIHDTE